MAAHAVNVNIMPTIDEQVKKLEETETEIKVRTEELEKTKATNADFEKQNSALAQEKQRVLDELKVLREEKEKAKHKDETFSEKFRRENLQKVSQKIISELGLKPEEFKSVDDAYIASKADSISEDSIYQDMMKIYASQHATELIGSHKRIKELEANAQQYNANQSTGAGAGANFPNPNREINITPEDEQAARWAGVSIEQYKKWKTEGKI